MQLDRPAAGNPSASDPQAQASDRQERRDRAKAYLAWEATADRADLDELDRATAAMSLDGAEW